MKSKNSGLFVVVSALGVVVCVAAVLGFVFTIDGNNLPWVHGDSVRAHYTAVTESYSQGFLVGFFLCLFLVMCAISLRSWAFGKVDEYHARRAYRLQNARPQTPPSG